MTFLLAHAYGMGGTTRTCLNVAGHLAARHEVEVLSMVRRRTKPVFQHPAGVTVTPIDDRVSGHSGWFLRRFPSLLVLPVDRRMNAWSSLQTDLELVRALWRVRSGVLIGTRPSLNVLVAATRRPGLAGIGQEHMNLDSHRPDMRSELMRCYPKLDVTVLLTEHDRAAFRAALAPGTPLAVIPNAFTRLPGGRARLDRKTVIAVGRLTPQKGFDLLIPAFAQVVDARPDWSLCICGGGAGRSGLEQSVADHGISEHVTLLGPVRHIERQLLRASIFVLSSRFEGFPMAMLEGMSKGLPVVAFDCPTGPAEIVEHGKSGLLVPNGDVAGLAEAMLELIENDELRHRQGAAAAVRARAFSLDDVGQRWERLIADAAAPDER